MKEMLVVLEAILFLGVARKLSVKRVHHNAVARLSIMCSTLDIGWNPRSNNQDEA
jgi:hypothetical protein